MGPRRWNIHFARKLACFIRCCKVAVRAILRHWHLKGISPALPFRPLCCGVTRTKSHWGSKEPVASSTSKACKECSQLQPLLFINIFLSGGSCQPRCGFQQSSKWQGGRCTSRQRASPLEARGVTGRLDKAMAGLRAYIASGGGMLRNVARPDERQRHNNLAHLKMSPVFVRSQIL